MNLFINCSPKRKKSASNKIIMDIKSDDDKIIFLYNDELNKINMKEYNNIIFVYPLYVDAPPSKLIEYMENVKKDELKNKNIYIIVNCGFLEPHQNNISIEIMKIFINKQGANYMGSFKIGTGPVIGESDTNKLYKFASRDYYKKIKMYKKDINNNNKAEYSTRIKPMEKRLFTLLANNSFKKIMKKNGL